MTDPQYPKPAADPRLDIRCSHELIYPDCPVCHRTTGGAPNRDPGEHGATDNEAWRSYAGELARVLEFMGVDADALAALAIVAPDAEGTATDLPPIGADEAQAARLVADTTRLYRTLTGHALDVASGTDAFATAHAALARLAARILLDIGDHEHVSASTTATDTLVRELVNDGRVSVENIDEHAEHVDRIMRVLAVQVADHKRTVIDVSEQPLPSEVAALADARIAEGKAEALDGSHLYLSTGCLHGDHVLDDGRTGHEYCQSDTGHAGSKRPGRCKFCNAPCVCPCHKEGATK